MHLSKDSRVLITGSTGVIGGAVAQQLRERGVRLWHLVRARSPGHARARILDGPGPQSAVGEIGRERCLAGDISRPRLGLGAAELDELRAEIDVVLHLAADTSLAGWNADEVNRLGMAQLLEVVSSMRASPLLVYVSTAYVAGVARDACLAEDHGRPSVAAHPSPYTASKAAAEDALALSGLEHLVVRPSIVVPPPPARCPGLEFFTRTAVSLPMLPVRAEALVDTVPLRFVAEATLAAAGSPTRRHRVYNISAGPRHAIRCADLARIGCEECGRRTPLALVDPERWSDGDVPIQDHRRRLGALAPFLPFLNQSLTFDNTRILDEWPALREHLTPAPDYLRPAVRHWLSTATAPRPVHPERSSPATRAPSA